MSNRTPIQIGVIGVGFGTKVQIPAFLSEGVGVSAVCAAHEERAEKAADEFGIPQVYTDYKKMIHEADIDAVSIVTPPFLHHEMALEAINAGKHVICEKPFALNSKEATEMYEAASNSNITAMIAHEFRFAPARSYIKELIQQGYIGTIRDIQITLFVGPTMPTAPRPMAWGSESNKGGGFLGALGSHYLDCLRDWCGEMDAINGQVFSHDPARTLNNTTVTADSDDAFSFQVKFSNGALASMNANSVAPYGNGAQIDIFGSEGSLRTTQSGFNPTPDGKVWAARYSDGPAMKELPMPERHFPIFDDRDERLPAFRVLVKRFLRGIEEGSSLYPNFYDGLKCQEALDAIRSISSEEYWKELR
ncbi:MAG: hypothetical protein CL785_00350 [Chloroflexi bacterium]|nr:hypothetical protein [Chloroflexota bacterium]|tara:strand:- start:25 stop:1110 length:1086 start_codon:yes stop_codon:yes gene_type:complete